MAEEFVMPVRTHTVWEYGIEYRRAYNDFKPTVEWGGYSGMGGYHQPYTADNVFALAGKNPVYRRRRTTFEPVTGPPERFER